MLEDSKGVLLKESVLGYHNLGLELQVGYFFSNSFLVVFCNHELSVLQSNRDALLTGRTSNESEQALGKGSSLLNLGHFLLTEDRQVILQEVDSFLDELDENLN